LNFSTILPGSGELQAARDAAVVCELAPLAALRVAGADAEAFLQGQLTSDVAALARAHAQYSAWCSPKGRVLANFLLRRLDAQSLLLLLPEALAAPIRRRLALFVLRSKVTIEDASGASVRIGIGGPAAAGCLASALGVVPAAFRFEAIDGGALAGLPGGRFIAIVVSEQARALRDRLAACATTAGFASWQWLTIRAGVPMILPATQDQFIPQMLNWDALGGVSFQKGCYAGQEIIARTQYLGRLKERLILAHADFEEAPDPGTRVFSASFGEQPCGTVINAAAAPGGGSDLLAVCQIAAAASADLRLGAPGGPALSLLALPYEVPAAAPRRGGVV
jgi:tRNA-modifying protein YgfZ